MKFAILGALTLPLLFQWTADRHADSHRHGGYDEISTSTPTANAIPKADASGKLDDWVTPGGGGGVWGSITGTLSNQTDLQTALDGKEPAGVNFTELVGAATDAQIPNTITLDNLTQVTTRAISDTTGTLAVARGGTNLTASTDDNVLVGNGTTWESKSIPDCDGDTTVLHYDTATNTFSCGDDDTAGGGPTTLISLSDASDAVIATYTAVPNISFSAVANTRYIIECYIIYTSTAATTGINFALDTPASPTGIHMVGDTKTVATGANEGFSQNTDNVGTNTSAAVITTENLARLHFLFRNGANAGTTTLGFTPETANSVTVKTGSVCQYTTY